MCLVQTRGCVNEINLVKIWDYVKEIDWTIGQNFGKEMAD